MLGMVIIVLYNMADIFFVGQTGDSNQVAAVSLVMPAFLIFMAVGNLIGVGGTSLVSRALGAGKINEIGSISSFCFYVSLLFGILLIIIYWLFMPWILDVLGTRDDTFIPAKNYLFFISISAPFVIITISFNNILRAEGYSNRSVLGMILGAIINIVLDPFMIIVLKMGVTGAAISTLIGYIVSALYYTKICNSKCSNLSVSWKEFQIRPRMVIDVLAIGVPVSINNILMSLTSGFQNHIISQYGSDAMAGLGIASRMIIIVILLQVALGYSVQPIFGYCYGAKNKEKFNSFLKTSLILSFLIGLGLTMVVFINDALLSNYFISNSDISALAKHFSDILIISGPLIGWQFIFRSTLQAAGSVKGSFILSICRQGVFFIPLVFILNNYIGVDGVVLAQPIADILAVFISAFLYYFYVNKRFLYGIL